MIRQIDLLGGGAAAAVVACFYNAASEGERERKVSHVITDFLSRARN